MMAGSGENHVAGGGPVRHIPVLLDAVLTVLEPSPGKRFLDGTFGAGGYSRALLERGATVVAIDRDPDAVAAGGALIERYGDRFRLELGRFSEMERIAGEPVDGVVLDVGVSSMQLDQAERGFSFMRDGPLDMRMGRQGQTAADIVNRMKASDMARIFGLLGEERHAGRIARAIERQRAEEPLATTGDLVRLVEKVVGYKPGEKIHPATRVFQALRIFINDELSELAKALFAAERLLKPGGVLAVVTFHSLEDRIVKRFLAGRSSPPSPSRHMPAAVSFETTFDKPIKPISASEAEVRENPRARSARLRAAKRSAAPAGKKDLRMLGVPALFVTEQLGGR